MDQHSESRPRAAFPFVGYNEAMKIYHYLLIVIVLIGGFFLLKEQKAETVPEMPEEVVTPEGAPTFEWSYSEPVEKDYIPYSTISLTATYPGGETRVKEIETIEGGCNEYPEPDADIYKDSTMIICYYAGFGRYYKVIESDGGYAVQRKEFEEASPDYNPPVRGFETVAKF